ncbi:hypothetical protein MC7420_3765 [Coleofasciculus chthonoplastes PCC 7420]|uniref:Uncharacterized protein n=1 Tax=Coleofasciculus chthonoplastes PCC 7420 TaxID=118168 RepID=B4VX25_9CYAN|nr:hypothetical protein [Coleofasciculus chthonoplastes]EDX73591.1 hypothetical protein MC7420_3765 [Coleofasciculus chthonoplastes PCC 7420]
MFHVGGGAIAVWETPQSTLGAGLFATPVTSGLLKQNQTWRSSPRNLGNCLAAASSTFKP